MSNTYSQPTIHLSKIAAAENYREFLDESELAELTASVKQRGVLEPIIVRPAVDGERFIIIAGERRFRAAQVAFNGDYEMPVVVRDVTDIEAAEIQVTENAHRSNPSPIEEAQAAQKIVYAYRGKAEAARALGWSLEFLRAVTSAPRPIFIAGSKHAGGPRSSGQREPVKLDGNRGVIRGRIAPAGDPRQRCDA